VLNAVDLLRRVDFSHMWLENRRKQANRPAAPYSNSVGDEIWSMSHRLRAQAVAAHCHLSPASLVRRVPRTLRSHVLQERLPRLALQSSPPHLPPPQTRGLHLPFVTASARPPPAQQPKRLEPSSAGSPGQHPHAANRIDKSHHR
jgi:hypothetical protein